MSDASGGTPGSGGPQVPYGAYPVPPEQQPTSMSASAVAEPPAAPPSGPTAPPPGMPGPHGSGGGRRGGVVVGIVLIVLGALMLFGRYAPWLDILRLWPLLIIAGGITEMVRQRGDAPIKKIAEGLGSVVVGLILLGNSFGVIQWSVWFTLLSLWPMLLVGLGIELFGRGIRVDWVRALSNVVLTATLLYGVFVLGPGWNGSYGVFVPAAGQEVTFQQAAPHESSVTAGDAAIHVGATRLKVSGGAELAGISGKAPKGTEPTLQHSVTGNVVQVDVTGPSHGGLILPYPERTLAIALDRAIAWDTVTLDAGAADAELDLRELKVSRIRAGIGASNFVLWIGAKSNSVTAEISGGATGVTIHVPANASVVLESQAGLSTINVPPSWSRESGIGVLGSSRWTSRSGSGPDIRIDVRTGVSSIDIKAY